MTNDELDLATARAFRDEGLKLREQAYLDRREADRALAAAEQLRGAVAHDRREIAELEQNIARREKALAAAGEPEFLAREQAAADKLAQAEELMRRYDKDRHGAAIFLRQELERAERERAAETAPEEAA